MKLTSIIFISVLLLGCTENNSRFSDEDNYREEYRNDPQAQSLYESEEEYIQDRRIEESQ